MSDLTPNSQQSQLQPATRKKYTRIAGNPHMETVVLTKHLAGENNTKIANDLGVGRQTISRVLNDEQMTQYVEYGRSKAISLIPKSLKVAEYKLNRNDGTMALGILRGTRVLQNEQVTVNTQNNFAFGYAQLLEQSAGDQANVATTPQLVVDTPVIEPAKPAKSKRINKRKLS